MAHRARLVVRRRDAAPDARPDLPGRPRGVLRPGRRDPPLHRCHRPHGTRCSRSSATRVAPATYNAQHPGSFSYFTPPPLPSSIAGEVLAQWIHQGVDVWHAGPVGTFVEEEVTAWLRDLVGFGPEGWGVLTSGGVMANVMAMTVARDVWLRELRGIAGAPRGADLEGVRVYVSDQAHFSIAPRPGGARLPRRDPRGDRRATSGSGCGPNRWPRRSGATGPPARRPSRSRRWPAPRTPDRSTTRRASPTSPSARACGFTSTPPTGAPRGCPVATLTACPGSSEPTASRSTRTSGSSRPTTSARSWSADARTCSTTFHQAPEYYASNRPEDEPLNWYQYSLEGTRRFRGLKLWMSWKQLGTDGLGALIERNDDLAAYLAARCAAEPDFEAVPAVPDLCVVCFRHLPEGHAGWPSEALDDYQRAAAARARGQWRGVGERHHPAWPDLPARRRRELPVDGGRRRPHARAPYAPVRRAVVIASSTSA